jgi:hypothetical protein
MGKAPGTCGIVQDIPPASQEDLLPSRARGHGSYKVGKFCGPGSLQSRAGNGAASEHGAASQREVFNTIMARSR